MKVPAGYTRWPSGLTVMATRGVVLDLCADAKSQGLDAVAGDLPADAAFLELLRDSGFTGTTRFAMDRI